MTEAEFEQLYTHFAPSLTRAVLALTGDLGEAQDVVQETFTRAWTRRATFSAIAEPHAWLRTVAMRLAVSRWRRTRNSARAWLLRRDEQDAGEISPDSVALVTALQGIPHAQRTAVVLHYLYDLPLDQIAEETSSSVASVKSRLFRARRSLAHLLTDQLEETPHV